MKNAMPFICDFCSETPVTQCYPAHTFDVKVIGDLLREVSITAWAACDVCHNMIQRGDAVALAVRSLNLLLIAAPDMKENANEIFGDLSNLHKGVFANRTGEPTPYESEAL
jgi:hypothetical protein